MTTGLTPFLIAMMRTPLDRLAGADTQKLASKYEIPAAWAAFCLQQWMNR